MLLPPLTIKDQSDATIPHPAVAVGHIELPVLIHRSRRTVVGRTAEAALLGSIADVAALLKHDISIRRFLTNRAADVIDVAGTELVLATVGAGLAAAPIEVPAIVGVGVALGAQVVIRRATRSFLRTLVQPA